jgi:thioredoxin reductase
VVIVGAGPYGLSIAAHLQKAGVNFRIFGTPMENWKERMPKGMLLKSEGFASSLFDPDRAFTLGHYCKQMGIPYEDVGAPVECKTFVEYGLEFQRRLVPNLERTNVTRLERQGKQFLVGTAAGETFLADRVVLAVGITHFAYLPPLLEGLPAEYVSHSLHHHDLSVFKGRKVAVVGGGASAVDLAGLLHEAGCESHLIARREAIAFHQPTKEPRSLRQRVLMPRSGLGLGWRSRMCTDAPLVFHRLPRKLRLRAVQRHLGPAPGWFARQKIEGRVPMHLGATIKGVSIRDGRVCLSLEHRDGRESSVEADHVIGATGFRTDLARLRFMDEELRKQVRLEDGAPVLSSAFECSVPGLYFVGLASASFFGPLTRFAYGAKFTSAHLSRHLCASKVRVEKFRHAEHALTELSKGSTG